MNSAVAQHWEQTVALKTTWVIKWQMGHPVVSRSLLICHLRIQKGALKSHQMCHKSTSSTPFGTWPWLPFYEVILFKIWTDSLALPVGLGDLATRPFLEGPEKKGQKNVRDILSFSQRVFFLCWSLTFGPFGPASPSCPCGPWGPWSRAEETLLFIYLRQWKEMWNLTLVW